jgi:hypothetical protein
MNIIRRRPRNPAPGSDWQLHDGGAFDRTVAIRLEFLNRDEPRQKGLVIPQRKLRIRLPRIFAIAAVEGHPRLRGRQNRPSGDF